MFVKISEQPSLYNDLEKKSVREILEDINTEDQLSLIHIYADSDVCGIHPADAVHSTAGRGDYGGRNNPHQHVQHQMCIRDRQRGDRTSPG